MQRVDGRLIFSPSDLNHFVDCEHLTALDLLHIEGAGIEKDKDPQAEIIRAKGFEHEAAWLERLRAEGKQIVEVAASSQPHWAKIR